MCLFAALGSQWESLSDGFSERAGNAHALVEKDTRQMANVRCLVGASAEVRWSDWLSGKVWLEIFSMRDACEWSMEEVKTMVPAYCGNGLQ